MIKLPEFPYSSRLKRLQEALRLKNINKALVLKPENTYYLSLFQAIIYSRPIAVIIPEEGDPTLIVPYLDLEHARERSPIPEVKHYYREEEFYKILKEELTDTKKLGLDTDSLSMYFKIRELFRDSEVLHISEDIERLRMIKDEAEIRRIRLAAEVTDFGMKEVMKALSERQSEINVATRGEYAMKMRLAEVFGSEGFYPWMNWTVAAALSGPRSFYPHGMVSGRKIQDGDVIIVTLDIAVEGYRAENERTFIVGKPSPETERYFNLMEEAHLSAIKSISPGRLTDEVDRSSRNVFNVSSTLKYTKHRTGHGIGLEIHEKPFLAEGDGTVLRNGMVLCVEPGIYVPKLGGFRHSDTVLVNDGGCEVLTKTPKGLTALSL